MSLTSVNADENNRTRRHAADVEIRFRQPRPQAHVSHHVNGTRRWLWNSKNGLGDTVAAARSAWKSSD